MHCPYFIVLQYATPFRFLAVCRRGLIGVRFLARVPINPGLRTRGSEPNINDFGIIHYI